MPIVDVIADPIGPPLGCERIGRLARELGARLIWLAEAEACRLVVRRPTPGRAAAIVRDALAGTSADVVARATAGPGCRLLISDVDATLITVECIEELADYAGARSEVAAITARAMNGDLDFRTALEQRVVLLAGLPTTIFEEVYRERCRPMPGAATLAATMRARGAMTAMVSGGFHELVDRLRSDLAFDVSVANRLEVAGGRLTGRLRPPIVDGHRKRMVLNRLCQSHGLDRGATIAVGDGANDLAMLQAAGLGVAFRAKPTVAAAAPHAIHHGDLTALLYLQGIPKAAFVEVGEARA